MASLNGFPNVSQGVTCLYYPQISNTSCSNCTVPYKYQLVGTVDAGPLQFQSNSTMQEMVFCAPRPSDQYIEISNITLAQQLANQTVFAEAPIVRPDLLAFQSYNPGYKQLSTFTFTCNATNFVGKEYFILCDNNNFSLTTDGQFVSKDTISQSGGVYLRSDPISTSFSKGVIAMWALFWVVVGVTIFCCARFDLFCKRKGQDCV